MKNPSKFLLVGLGNPGRRYAATRHNAGAMFASWIARHPIAGVDVAKIDCYMNESGPAIAGILVPSRRLVIAHDDLDLPLGGFKIQDAKGPHQHRGLLSVEAALNTARFLRVRIGVDSRIVSAGEQRESGEAFTLKPFRRDEKKTLISLFPKIRSLLAHETSIRLVRA